MTLTKRWRYTPAAIQEHTGLAADTKPTSNVPYQSTFLETDTGKQYVYDGTAWVQVAGTIVVDGVKETAEAQETGSVGAIGWLSSIKGFLRKLYATTGISTGAKVITDANGTLQQYLRGLVSLAVSGITVKQPTAANLKATVTQATPIGAPVEDVTIYLVGADLTTDGIAYSDVKETVDADTDITVYEYTFEPESGGGTLLWLYFNIVATLKAQNGTADLKMTMQIRDKDGTWQTLFTQVTYADIGTGYLDKRYEGYLVKDAAAYCTPGDADLWTYLTSVPFDFRILLQSNETAAASGRGYGKIKNSSLIRAIYNTE